MFDRERESGAERKSQNWLIIQGITTHYFRCSKVSQWGSVIDVIKRELFKRFSSNHLRRHTHTDTIIDEFKRSVVMAKGA